jgi:hypothetical protein
MDHNLTPDDAIDLTDDDPLHDVLGQLTSPATQAELSGGEAMVVRMARILRARRTAAARAAVTAGAAMVLFTGAAAATGGSILEPHTADEPATSVEGEAPEVEPAPAGDEQDTADDQDEVDVVDPTETADPASSIFDDPEVQAACDSAMTHGEFVSGVAHDRVDGTNHGTRVSEAARSQCGKTVDGTDPAPVVDPESTEADEESTESPSQPAHGHSAKPDDANHRGQSGRHGKPQSSGRPAQG